LADIEVFHFTKHLIKFVAFFEKSLQNCIFRHFEFKLHKDHPMPVVETEEGWLNFWSRKCHDTPKHHHLQPKERKFLLVPRLN